MQATIRDYEVTDAEAVVALSLRAWAPVFASLAAVLGEAIFRRLHPDWRSDQEQAVRAVLGDPESRAFVAEAASRVVGFVTAATDDGRGLGEITMLAVDPPAQGRGLGTELTRRATEWLRSAGMTVAMVETGGDPGHAPARRAYEKASYTLLPVARYFTAL